MGLFGKRIKDGVDGEARVMALAPTRRGARQTEKRNVQMQLSLEVSGPGFGPVRIEHVDTVPHEKSPIVGDVLQISVSPHDPSNLKIDWDAAPELGARFMASAEAAQRGDDKGAAEALGFTLKEDDET